MRGCLCSENLSQTISGISLNKSASPKETSQDETARALDTVANIECLATISSWRCILPFANDGEAYWEHYFACKVDQLRNRFPLMTSLSKRQKWI